LVNSPYSENVYCWHKAKGADDAHEIWRVNLSTLEREHVVSVKDIPPIYAGLTASPDGKYIVSSTFGPGVCKLVSVSLEDGSWSIVAEDSHPLRHFHFGPSVGDGIAVQLDRAAKIDKEGNVDRFADTTLGNTHFIVQNDGNNRQPLPIGEPHTARSSGHSGWAGKSGRYAVAIEWNHNEHNEPGRPEDWSCDDRYPGCTLVTAAPGDESPTPFATPEHRFYMVSTTPGGKFFAATSVPTRKGPTCIVMGNFATGKYRILIHDGHNYAGSVWPSSGAHLSADNRYVIYRNRDEKYNDIEKYGRFAGFQVFVARVPDEFIKSLL